MEALREVVPLVGLKRVLRVRSCDSAMGLHVKHTDQFGDVWLVLNCVVEIWLAELPTITYCLPVIITHFKIRHIS